jgi:hypothetical protein
MVNEVLYSDPEFRGRFDTIQATLTARINKAVDELQRRIHDHWGPDTETAQRMFGKTSLDELIDAAVTVFLLTHIIRVAELKEADLPPMAKSMFTTLFGYVLKAQIEIERETKA